MGGDMTAQCQYLPDLQHVEMLDSSEAWEGAGFPDLEACAFWYIACLACVFGYMCPEACEEQISKTRSVHFF